MEGGLVLDEDWTGGTFLRCSSTIADWHTFISELKYVQKWHCMEGRPDFHGVLWRGTFLLHCLKRKSKIPSQDTILKWIDSSLKTFFCILISFHSPTPPLKINNHRTPSTPRNDPDDLLIALVRFLVLGPGWNQGEVAGAKLLAGLAVVGYYGAVAGFGEDYCVLFAVMVDCGGCMRFCYHY